jgi:protein-S-isoprenylcysteine O-methyltransferase Ste14
LAELPSLRSLLPGGLRRASPKEKRLRRLPASRLLLSVLFCLGLALFAWLQSGTYALATREDAVGNLANGRSLRQIVIGETALLLICALSLLSLRRTWFARIGILTLFIWAICLVDLAAFLQATMVG